MPINVAVVGYGFSAKTFHLPFILHNPGFHLHAIVQRTPRPADDAGADFPSAKIYHDANDAIQDDDVQLLVITSTNVTHYPLSKRALESGKHVIVEKPFTCTYIEAEELVSLATEKQLQLAVYHNRRWDTDFQTVKSLLSAPTNPLGRITRFRSHMDCSPNSRTANEAQGWRLAANTPGAGMLFDLGSHMIDQAVVLFGVPDKITAFLMREGEGMEVDDGFVIVLGYAGVTVELHSTQYSVNAHQKRFEILGTKGRWFKTGLDCQEEQLQAGIHPGHPDYAVEKPDCATLEIVDGEEIKKTSWDMVRGGYQNFYQNVYEAITGQAELSVKPSEAANVMRLIELCQQSAKEGRTLCVTV